jgi:hypothetical protein
MPRKVTRILNCIPSRDTDRDWTYSDAVMASAIKAPVAIPASIDMRETWWKINNQENTGSCVGWATADSVIRWHFVKAGKIEKKDLLSPRFIWMAAKETDEFITAPTTFIEMAGTSLKAALDITRKYGVVTIDILPFASGKLYQNTPEVFYAIASQLKIASYHNLGRDINEWKNWLAVQGPILTRLGVDSTWDNANATQGKLDSYHPDTVRGGHAVAFVGYTKDRFIVRNSWGTDWGDKGFAFASYSYAQDAFTEAYGITI